MLFMHIILRMTKPAHNTLPEPVLADLEDLGRSLRAARARREETQASLATRVRVSRNTVRAAERGDPGVSAGVYAALVWALGLPGLAQHMPQSDSVPERVRASKRPIDDF